MVFGFTALLVSLQGAPFLFTGIVLARSSPDHFHKPMRHPNAFLVKRGTYRFHGAAPCPVEIWQTDYRPPIGGGDGIDVVVAEEASGTFFEIRYAQPGWDELEAVRWCDNLQEAVSVVESVFRIVQWSD
jgi:hypothetical protein